MPSRDGQSMPSQRKNAPFRSIHRPGSLTKTCSSSVSHPMTGHLGQRTPTETPVQTP